GTVAPGSSPLDTFATVFSVDHRAHRKYQDDSCRLLLREAVQRAESPDQIDGVDADDFAIGEAAGDDVEGVAVVGIVESGDEYQAIRDVEVGIARREALALKEDGRGHGQLDDTEWFATKVARGAQTVEVLGERQVVLVAGVGFHAGEDGVVSDEAGDVIDVAVRVVAGAAFVKPYRLLNPQIVTEGALKRRAGRRFVADAWIALLDL